MQIEKDKKYIVSLKTIEEYKELLKIVPWYNGAGTKGWKKYPYNGGFAVRVEIG